MLNKVCLHGDTKGEKRLYVNRMKPLVKKNGVLKHSSPIVKPLVCPCVIDSVTPKTKSYNEKNKQR